MFNIHSFIHYKALRIHSTRCTQCIQLDSHRLKLPDTHFPPYPQKYNYCTFGRKMFKSLYRVETTISIYGIVHHSHTHQRERMSYTITSAPSSQRLPNIQINQGTHSALHNHVPS